MIIDFSQINKDQEGLDQIKPWNVHSTTKEPVIFPGNALGMYFFKGPHYLMGDNELIPGLYQYNRYNNLIIETIK